MSLVSSTFVCQAIGMDVSFFVLWKVERSYSGLDIIGYEIQNCLGKSTLKDFQAPEAGIGIDHAFTSKSLEIVC